jgi:hypothetical protein
MATNFSIDPDLIERALKVTGERTKKACGRSPRAASPRRRRRRLRHCVKLWKAAKPSFPRG